MKRNLFVYVTALFCGMSVMAVELSASRLLSTTFSSSSVIWTIVIGLIMISLSLGNILGGRMADKHQNGDKLYSLIFIASIWIAVIPLVGKYIIDLSVVLFMWILPNNLIIAGSILSCLVIFSFPLVILGMASPFLVKLGVSDMKNNGKTTGEIYALSTIGSIIGTFIPTFLTIPTIGTSKTFFIFALILNFISLYYFIAKKAKILKIAVFSVIILFLTIAPLNDSYAFWENNIVYEGESLYNYLKVTEDNEKVVLSTNVAFGVQSIYKKDSSLSGYYYDYALMAPLFMKNFDFNKNMDVLILGLGTGTFAKQCKRFYPGTVTDGVEIDKKIVDLSKKYFDLKDDEANIFVTDGRTFLMGKDVKKYDLIMVDAYRDITIPFHMSTKEFFAEVKKHLNDSGVLIMNINMRSNKNNEITDYLTQTVKYNMAKVYKCDMENGSNTLVFATNVSDSLKIYADNIEKINESHPLFSISRYVKENMKEVTESNHVLTDEVAPVEIMGQKILDEVISNELDYFKKEIGSSKNGIKDIFKIISGQSE